MNETADSAELSLVTVPDPNTAVGLAVRYMLDKPVYAEIPFGTWAGALNGQVNRGHYGFVLNGEGQVVGFIGWALAPEEKADAWVENQAILSDAECRDGDCVIFNSFIADTKAVHDFIWDAVRAAVLDKKALYYRRAYPDGRVRPVKIPVTEFFDLRVARAAPAREPAVSGDGRGD